MSIPPGLVYAIAGKCGRKTSVRCEVVPVRDEQRRDARRVDNKGNVVRSVEAAGALRKEAVRNSTPLDHVKSNTKSVE